MDKSTKWFIIIIGGLTIFGFFSFLFLYFILTGLATEGSREEVVGSGEKIAVIELNGVITDSKDIVRQFKKYRQDRSIKGILFRVESPGGGVVPSQEIFEEVKKTREKSKPIVVSMGSLAASGGYYVSCPANRIVANPGTLTGSIGVISQFIRYDSLLGKIGVEVNTIKSGKFKDAGNPFRPMENIDRAYFQTLMDDVHKQFIDAVENNRKISHDELLKIADGRVFTGLQALTLGLIDTLGTYEDAIMITAKLSGIRGEPSIVREKKKAFSILDQILGNSRIAKFLGLEDKIFNQSILQFRMAEVY